MAYSTEAKSIWQQYVPKSGQAETVQGELLRAVEKLRNEASRNGNMNWDEGFEILLSYLSDHLLDKGVFSTVALERTGAILSRLREFEDPLVEDPPYDELADRVVEYFRHYGPQSHVANPQLRR